MLIDDVELQQRKDRCRTLLMKGLDNEHMVENLMRTLDSSGFFIAPASTNKHGAYAGGLYDHSEQVTLQLVNLTERLGISWELPRSPYIVGLFHDLCKIDSYYFVDDEIKYNNDLMLNGHGDKSLIRAMQLLQLSEEEMMAIRWHMGAFDVKENWKCYSKAVNKYPVVLFTHTADMIASQVLGV